jgi:predicted pyridoxine 5'-phosphate oxidase superfamily flavin-nucleotide-binding protein
MIKERLVKFFRHTQFVDVATCDKNCRPNNAPKFILKIDGDKIYLADYVLGTTWNNLKENPLVSLTVVDNDSLIGYQFNGEAVLLDEGDDYETLRQEFQVKKVKSSVDRIIKSVRAEKPNHSVELSFPDRTGIIIIIIREIVDIGPTGQILRDK